MTTHSCNPAFGKPKHEIRGFQAFLAYKTRNFLKTKGGEVKGGGGKGLKEKMGQGGRMKGEKEESREMGRGRIKGEE